MPPTVTISVLVTTTSGCKARRVSDHLGQSKAMSPYEMRQVGDREVWMNQFDLRPNGHPTSHIPVFLHGIVSFMKYHRGTGRQLRHISEHFRQVPIRPNQTIPGIDKKNFRKRIGHWSISH